ncbi:MAG: hypothetical protein WCO02_09375 [Bacteroidota bacterium]
MQKVMVICRGQEGVSYSAFVDYMLRLGGQALEICHPQKLHITFTDSTTPYVSVIPFKDKKIGVISISSEEGLLCASIQEFLGYCMTETKKSGCRFSGAYQVEEALPVEYSKTWQDVEMTPGACLLTLFKRKPGLTYEAFINRWHNSHTPLSLKIHPLWHYSRNVVLETAGEKSETWEGIVEEHVKKRSHLLNPMKFFGNPLSMIPNMIEVYKDTNAFLDYKTIETYLVREVVLRS